MLTADVQRFLQTRGTVIGSSDETHFALAHKRIESSQRLLKWSLCVIAVRQIQVVLLGLKAAQRSLYLFHNVAPREAMCIRSRAHTASHLGC